MDSMARTSGSPWRRRCLAFATVAVLGLLTSCKQKPTAVANRPAANAQVALPAIQTSGVSTFGGDSWLKQKQAHDRNVTAGAGKSFANITYKPEVKIVDKAAIDASIQGISSNGRGVIFKGASPEIRALKAGDILLVKNAFAAKILVAENDGDQTALITDQANLSDVVQSGEINVDTPISFHGPSVASASPPRPFHLMELLETPVYAQNGTGEGPAPGAFLPGTSPKPGRDVDSPTKTVRDAAVDALTSGWKVESYSVVPSNNSAIISARLSKYTSGFKAVVETDGSITNFQFVSNLKFSQNTGQQAIRGVQGMSGKMHFVWEIGKDTPGVWAAEDKVKLPAGVSIPLGPELAGLPLSIDIYAAFLIHPALTGGGEYSKGGFTIGWVGSNSDAADNGASEGLTFQVTDDQNISPVAPNGMVISVCVPRIELKLALLGSYGSDNFFKTAAAAIDTAIDAIARHFLSPSAFAAYTASPQGNMTATNILGSQADIYVQVIHTEGVTHAPNIGLAPCSKQELKITGQIGGEAKLLGLTKGAPSTKDVFTKTFTRWDPASNFCKGI
jgi:hypothetical protein